MTAARPGVTVGLPVYNGAAYVRRALDSLLAQDHPALQVVVSDNASDDGTWELLQEYADDPRVRLVRQPHNVGSLRNFAAVLAEASTPYFVWAACDDLWEPDFVSSLVAELEAHPGAVVAMSALDHVLDGRRVGPVVRYTGDDDPNGMGLLRRSLQQAAGAKHFQFVYGLYRTEVLRLVYRDSPQVACADGLLVLHAALAGELRYVDRVLTTRQLSEIPWEQRYPGDPMGARMISPYAYLLTLVAAVPYLVRSPALPWHRKLLLPLVLGRLALWLLPLSAGTLRLQRRASSGPSRPGTPGGSPAS